MRIKTNALVEKNEDVKKDTFENSPILSFDCEGIPVTGDVKIEFFHKNTTVRITCTHSSDHYNLSPLCSQNRLFWFWFNTAFIPEGSPMTFHKTVIDKACKDSKCKIFKQNFRVILHFQKVVGAQQKVGVYNVPSQTQAPRHSLPPKRPGVLTPTADNKPLLDVQTRTAPSVSSPTAFVRRRSAIFSPSYSSSSSSFLTLLIQCRAFTPSRTPPPAPSENTLNTMMSKASGTTSPTKNLSPPRSSTPALPLVLC